MKKNMQSQPGVTLIMVSGVLVILSAMAAGFYVMVTTQTKTALGYADTVHAELMARAGVNDAITRLREGSFLKLEDPTDPWFTVDYLHGATKRISYPNLDRTNADSAGQPRRMSFSRSIQNSSNEINSDNYTLEISDASSKINVNAGDNLAVLLDNLCRVIGAPLVAADLDRLQPAVWASLGAKGYGTNPDDKPSQGSCYYMPSDPQNKFIDGSKPPLTNVDGSSIYGDGYAIARYRAVNGRFGRIEDVKNALTVKPNKANPELEALEREIKFNALKDYITIDSFVDTNTVCVGKFEWVTNDIAIDRDKSWIEDVGEAKDKYNHRGSLRGCYVAIINGHGAGHVRRIKTNGVDWIQIDPTWTKCNGTLLMPGPISSYMIIAKEDALTEDIPTNVNTSASSIAVPKTDPTTGQLIDDPNIDYERYPLCIHRAPVNINTASDKVLTAMFMGINITHGHYMSIGTEVDVDQTYDYWYKPDPRKLESRLSTQPGLKRLPVSSGKIIFDKSLKKLTSKLPKDYDLGYVNNYGALAGEDKINEAHELALRVMIARQNPRYVPKTGKYAADADPLSTNYTGSHNLTGPIKSWDDFYFRVVRPWDEERFKSDPKRGHSAQMVMAHFNSNTDILKFNPGIEWIDRWGRNFTEMEAVMAYDAGGNPIYITGKDPDYGTNYATYITRNMRYKADEVIDKTDLNRSTTEFCFDSGGIFEIHSVGRVVKNDNVLAERRYEALVQVYDVWRESTQRQFVNGTISEADNPSAKTGPLESFARSGKVVRDGTNHGGRRLALDTLPEPLVPLDYKLDSGGRNIDVVDTVKNGRNCYGVPITDGKPDVVANRILPASYDGQIVLATNTARYDIGGEEMDTFLASFNGDLDTDTSVGNGREQAKSPGDRKTRVVDTCSLLGVLNDTDPNHVDYDLADGTTGKYNTFRLSAFSNGLKPLDPSKYWDNVTCRQGDLRSEGVWLGYCGVSGNEGTLKYLVDASGSGPTVVRKNFNPDEGGAGNGCTVSMWFKSTWHHDDNRYHEFLNADNPGASAAARYFALVKGQGQPQSPDSNGLASSFEDRRDSDCQGSLNGGKGQDPLNRSKSSPNFRVQPFRWSYVGGVYKYHVPITAGGDFQGYGQGGSASRNNEILTKMCRPFISTQTHPEGPLWKPDFFYSRLNTGTFEWCDIGASTGGPKFNQQAAWDWADGGGGAAGASVFGMNNLNKDANNWLYRYTPIDGTMAVVDEFKVTKKMWDGDLIAQSMCTSRYYLPKDPTNKQLCPTFTSQSMLQSLRGFSTKTSDETVQPIRIGWTCFTPRFMHENIIPNSRTAPGGGYSQGPFSYLQYNYGVLNPSLDDSPGDRLGVIRPTLDDYLSRNGKKPPQSAAGIEIELLNGGVPIPGITEFPAGTYTPVTAFVNPNVFNGFPMATKAVKIQDLRYRVRFMYPIDPYLPDGGKTVDPQRHYLLDTPVFDDISITYSIVPKILDFREVTQ